MHHLERGEIPQEDRLEVFRDFTKPIGFSGR